MFSAIFRQKVSGATKKIKESSMSEVDINLICKMHDDVVEQDCCKRKVILLIDPSSSQNANQANYFSRQKSVLDVQNNPTHRNGVSRGLTVSQLSWSAAAQAIHNKGQVHTPVDGILVQHTEFVVRDLSALWAAH